VHQAIYERLQGIARAGRTISYHEIAPLAGLDMGNPAHRNEIAEILYEISTHEHREGRPLLSAVVIREDENLPGQGFFTMARELGLYTGTDDVAFFAQELTRVFAAWRNG